MAAHRLGQGFSTRASPSTMRVVLLAALLKMAAGTQKLSSAGTSRVQSACRARLGPSIGNQKAYLQPFHNSQETIPATRLQRLSRPRVRPIRSSVSNALGQTFSAAESSMMTVVEHDGYALDKYLTQVERVVNVTFPDSNRRTRMGDDTWKVQLLPQEFVGIRFSPVTRLRVFYDDGSLHIEVSDLELGLPPQLVVAPPILRVRGTLKPAVRLPRNKILLKGTVEMALTAALPAQLMLIPGIQSFGEALLRSILQQLKASLESGITTDYKKWAKA
ncbi:hypothetical protein AAMO2058_000659500 [Amorphochlora amoebiformis]